MSFVYKNGIAFDNLADLLEDGADGLYASLAAMGWTLHNEVSATPGATDKIYKSTGEDGTEFLLIRITQTSSVAVLLRIASYYVTGGSPGANDGNEVGVANYTHMGAADAAFVGWISGDKNFVALAYKQDTYYSTFGFGRPARINVEPRSARTTLNGAQNLLASGAGNTVLTVNTYNTAKLTTGQKLFIVNVGATNKGTIGRCTVVSVDSTTQITVINDNASQTNFDTGALVAFDPMPMCILGRGTNVGGYYRGSVYNQGLSFLYDVADTRRTGTAQTTPTHGFPTCSFGALKFYNDGYTVEGYNVVPGGDGEFIIMPLVLVGACNGLTGTITAGSAQVRGYIERVCSLGYSVAVSAEDTFADGSAEWVAFKDEYGSTTYPNYCKYFAVRTVA